MVQLNTCKCMQLWKTTAFFLSFGVLCREKSPGLLKKKALCFQILGNQTQILSGIYLVINMQLSVSKCL